MPLIRRRARSIAPPIDRADCPPVRQAPDTIWTDQDQYEGRHGPRADQGVKAKGLPRFERQETLLTDTELPDELPPFDLIMARFNVARNETLHVVRVGQRLVVRRPGRVPAPHGLPTEYLAGYDILVTWDLVVVQKDVLDEGAAATGIVLVPESGTAKIWSPWDKPRQTPHVLVPGPCAVVLQARVTGTVTVIRDALYELGGFLEAWRYLEGDLSRAEHFLALQAAQ